MKTVSSISRKRTEILREVTKHKICFWVFPKNARKIVVFNNFLDRKHLNDMMTIHAVSIGKAGDGKTEDAIYYDRKVGKKIEPPHLELVIEEMNGKDSISISKDGMGFEICQKGTSKMVFGFPEGYRYVDFERNLVACVIEVAEEGKESTLLYWPSDVQNLSLEETELLRNGIKRLNLNLKI